MIDIDLSPQELAEKLTLVGLELDGMHAAGGDHIFDIEVTSNRGDCLSHFGVVREISAFSNNEIKFPAHIEEQPKSGDSELVTILDEDLCNRFTARVIKGVKIGPSPEWLVKRLEAIGERSINNVADITNYVMHELGQPMHSFDLDKLSGNKIVVRRAASGERITTLDEVERKLDDSMLLICDAAKPVAVGGVMGGTDSGITESTTNVLLEVAYFDRDSIRQTSRKLNLSTEASYHFERGVDIENLTRASNRATKLICDLAGGKADKFVDVYPKRFEMREISAPNLKSEVKRLSDLEIAQTEIERILSKLGIAKKDEEIYVSPSWRHDLAIDEDLVEEIVRIYGYDKVGVELPPAIAAGEYQPNENRKKLLRRALSVLGFNEAISYSFIDSKHDEVFEIVPNLISGSSEDKFVSIKDPIIDGATRMRPSLLSGLLDAVKVNFNHQNKDVKLFEIGKVFAGGSREDGLPKEQELLGIVLTGSAIHADQSQSSRKLDFYDLKGALEAAADSTNSKPLDYRELNPKHLQPGQAAEVLFSGKAIGTIGRISNEIAANYKFKQPVFVAEVDLESILDEAQQATFYSPLAIYPSIVRDVSFLTKRALSFSEIKTEIIGYDLKLCRSVSFVDVFEGKGMESDERSITIRVEYRSDERTLTEDEVEVIHEKILESLTSSLNIKQR